MELFPLAIFPEGSLDSSIITTVWIGVLIFAFFNMRFGWTFSGLVVPGYLVPLLIVKPWSAVAVIIVSVVAYLQLYFLSEVMSKWGVWGNLFGRDRFFGLLLSGVVARLVFDAIVFPIAGVYLYETFAIDFDYRNNLQSFGLIVVTLLANQYWKPGLKKGFTQFGIILGLSYIVVRYGLVVYTNFSIANLQFMYEGISESLMASPKAYIILLTSAYIASKFNLFYGWDFNGILLPSLLALQLYEPGKIGTSIVEAGVIYVLASAILRLPFLKESSIEGARKLVFFFNISFLYKMGLGYFILTFFPDQQVSDFFGFGYLLPTLMALKIHEKQIFVRYTVTTLSAAFFSAFVGNLVGFSLTLLPQPWITAPLFSQGERPVPALTYRQESLVDVVRDEKMRMYTSLIPNSYRTPLPHEQNQFREGLRSILRYIQTQDETHLQMARSLLYAVHFQVEIVEERYLLLREHETAYGWGFYVIDSAKKSGLVIETPTPLDEWKILSSGLALFKEMDAWALASASTPRDINTNKASDVLLRPGSFFTIFHEIFSQQNVLQVRGFTPTSIRELMGVTVPTGNIDPPAVESTLWVSSRIPQGLHLANLEKMIGAFTVQWEAGPYRNIQRTISRSGFAELWLNYRDRRTLLARTFIEQDLVERTESISRIDGYLMDWLILTKGQIADRGSNLYVSPSEEELLYFDQEVVTPLLDLVKSGYANGAFTEIAEMDLSGIAASASQVGYQIVWYHHLPSKQDYLILSEGQDAEARNYRGTYIFRLGMAKPYMLHVPRPLYERSTFEFGVNLFEQLRASVILIAGAHKEANVDGSSDMIRPSNKKTFFNLVNQVVLREAKDDPMMVISCRAFGYRDDAPTTEADLILSRADGGITESSLSYLGMEVIHYLNQGLFEYVFVDGRWETAGYEAASMFQSKYLRQSVNKEFLAMWISPYTRRAYTLQDEAGRLESHFASLDIATSDVVLLDYLQAYRHLKKNEDVPSSLSGVVTRFLRTGDILALAQLKEALPEDGLLRVIDKNSKQTFLIVFAEPGYKPWVINLAARLNQIESVYLASELNQETLDQYISSHFAWLAW